MTVRGHLGAFQLKHARSLELIHCYDSFSLLFAILYHSLFFPPILQRVAWLLRKTLQVIEERISNHAENLKIVKYFRDFLSSNIQRLWFYTAHE
jgi:hypothetical protein